MLGGLDCCLVVGGTDIGTQWATRLWCLPWSPSCHVCETIDLAFTEHWVVQWLEQALAYGGIGQTLER